jgi:hypothetical protein
MDGGADRGGWCRRARPGATPARRKNEIILPPTTASDRRRRLVTGEHLLNSPARRSDANSRARPRRTTQTRSSVVVAAACRRLSSWSLFKGQSSRPLAECRGRCPSCLAAGHCVGPAGALGRPRRALRPHKGGRSRVLECEFRQAVVVVVADAQVGAPVASARSAGHAVCAAGGRRPHRKWPRRRPCSPGPLGELTGARLVRAGTKRAPGPELALDGGAARPAACWMRARGQLDLGAHAAGPAPHHLILPQAGASSRAARAWLRRRASQSGAHNLITIIQSPPVYGLAARRQQRERPAELLTRADGPSRPIGAGALRQARRRCVKPRPPLCAALGRPHLSSGVAAAGRPARSRRGTSVRRTMAAADDD